MAGISKKRIKTKTGEKVKYTITYTDIFGKRHTSGYYDTLKEARKELKRFETPKKISKITYGYIFQSFLDKSKMKSAEGTYLNYKIYYDKYLSQFDSIEYQKVNSIYWQKYFNELERNISPHVAQHCLKFAKASVNWQIKHDNIEFNIFNKIEPIKSPKADINHLTIDEIKKVLEYCKKIYPQYYALLYTFIGTGAREGEIFALEKKDFIYAEQKINIHKQFTKGKLLDHPKTASSNREIYIFKDLADVLYEHIKSNDSELLFPNKAGGYILAENFRRRVFYPLLKYCGINKRVRLHDLRGTYIDLTLSSGLSVKFAQNQTGHAKAETTLNIYARNNQDMINNAMNCLNSVFEKYQQNISKKIKNENCKIIQFPKMRLNKGF